MANSNEQVMASLRLPLMNSEENGDVVILEDEKVEEKTSKMDLKPWSKDHHLYILSVVDCMMFKKNDTDSINWEEVSRLMNFGKQTGQTEEWFTPKECENQYNHIMTIFEKEKENDEGLNHNDETPTQQLRVELFQKLMQERKKVADKKVAELQKEIAELSETIVSLETDDFDDRLSDISEANRSDSESEGPTSGSISNMDYDDRSPVSGIPEPPSELEFWDGLLGANYAWGPALEEVTGTAVQVDEGDDISGSDDAIVAEMCGPNRLVPGHNRRLNFNELEYAEMVYDRPVSPKLSNLLDNAIASGEPDVVPKSRPITPVNNAPTLSKLLEMPVRDRGQPLPTIQSLMEDSSAVLANESTPNYNNESSSPKSVLRDVQAPVKPLPMGAPSTPVNAKVVPTRKPSQHPTTNTLPALTLLMPRGPSKNLTLPDDIEMDDSFKSTVIPKRNDIPTINTPSDTAIDPNKSVEVLSGTDLSSQEGDISVSRELSVGQEIKETDDEEIKAIVASEVPAVADREKTERVTELESNKDDIVELNVKSDEQAPVDSSVVVNVEPEKIDDVASITNDDAVTPASNSNNKSSKTPPSNVEANNEIVSRIPTTPVRAASPNPQPEDSNSVENLKRKSPLKVASRIKDRTESEETLEEETSNSGLDSSAPTRVTRRSAKATFTKPSEEKTVVIDDSISSSSKEQEDSDLKNQPRVVRTGGKKHSESVASDAETKEEDTGKRVTRARNRASVAPRERTKSSSSTKGLTATDQGSVTSLDGDSVGAADQNVEPESGQDKDTNDNEPNVPEKPEILDVSIGTDATEPETSDKTADSSSVSKTESTPPKPIENAQGPDSSQPATVNEGKLPVDVDEESSEEITNKRKSPKPALRTKERIESGEMADDDNSNSGFDSSSKPRMTRRSGKLSPVKENKTGVPEDNKSSEAPETPRLKGRSTRKKLVIDDTRQTEVDSEVSEEVETDKRVTRARNRVSVTPRTRTKSSGSTKGLGTDQDASSETERSGPTRSLRSRGGPSTSTSSSVIDVLPPLPTSADSNPSSPSSSTTNSVIMEDEKELLKIKSALQIFYKRLIAPKSAQMFLKKSAIEPSPKYLQAVKKPVDLNIIKQRVDSGEIRSWLEMKREVLLMIINFCMFFPRSHPMHTAAQEYYRDVNHQFDIDFYNLPGSEDESNKDSSAKNDAETGSDSEQKTPEVKPKGKPGRKRRTPSCSVEEVVEPKRRTLRTSTTAVTTSSWQGARKSKQQQSPDIVSSYSRGGGD